MTYTMNEAHVYFDNRLGGEIGSEEELQMVLHMCRAFELAGYNTDRPFDEHLASSMEARCATCSGALIPTDSGPVCFYHVNDWEERYEAEQDRMRELYEDDCPPYGLNRPAFYPSEKNDIWHHECESFDCTKVVIYDDEPYCFAHSPDEGSSVRGYSASESFFLRNPAWLDDAM